MQSFINFTPLYVIIGLIIACLGYTILKLSHVVENRCKINARGYILDNTTLEHKGQTLYYPLVTYQIGDQHYTIQYKLGTKYSKYTPGHTVDIKINPNDHAEIFIMTDKSSTYEKLGERIMLAGLVIFVATLAIYFIFR